MARIETDAEATERHMRAALARKNEERWEALRQAAFDYVKAYNTWYTADYIDDAATRDGEILLEHAAAGLQTEAARYKKENV